MAVERRGQVIRVMINLGNWQQDDPTGCGGGRQLSMGGTSRVSREVHARFCESLGVQFPGATNVEDALTDLHAFSDEVIKLREAVGASQKYLQLANAQFKYGLVDYLTVIDAERTLLSNQLLLAQTVNLNIGASIRLIKALGGGWQNRP